MKTLDILSQKSRLRLSFEHRSDLCFCRSFILSMVLMTSFLSNNSVAQICQNYSICIEKPDPNEPIFHVILKMPAGGLTGIQSLNVTVNTSSGGAFVPSDAMKMYDIPGVNEGFSSSAFQVSYMVIFPPLPFNISGTSQTLFKVKTTADIIDNCVQVMTASFTSMTFESSLGLLCYPLAPSCTTFSNEHCFEGIDISGRIETTPPQECNGSINHGLPNATIDIIGEGGGAGYSQNTLTNASGAYAFRVAPAHKYTIVPDKSGPTNCGVTTLDISIIQSHIVWNNATLTTHRQLIAADMNQDDKVSTNDIPIIRRILFGLPPIGGPYPNWDFVAHTSYLVFNASPSPTGTLNIPPMDNIINQVFSSDAPNQDFIAIKMGDVNGSCTECGTEEFIGSSTDALMLALEHEVIDPRMNGMAKPSDKVALRVVVEDFAPEKGMEWLLPVRISDIESASVIAAGLRIDPTVLSILEVVPGELNESSADDFNATRIEEGELRFLWVSLDKKGASAAKDVIFYLRLRANEHLKSIAPFIKLDPVIFENVVHKGVESIHPLALQVTSAIHGHSAIPNPFGTNGTLLHFYMPASDIVNISLLDATGRLIEQNTALMEQGHHQWQVGTNLTLEQGIYYYVITGTNVRYSGKILKF